MHLEYRLCNTETNRANFAHGRLPSTWFASTQPPYGTSMPQSGRRPQHQKRRFDWRPVTSGLPRSTDILSLLRHATAAELGGGGSDRIEGQRLGRDAITSPASASSRQGVTVNGSRSDHCATQRYKAFGSPIRRSQIPDRSCHANAPTS